MADRWTRPWYQRPLPDRDITKHLTVGETVVKRARPSVAYWWWEMFEWWAPLLVMWPIAIISQRTLVIDVAFWLSIVICLRLLAGYVQIYYTRFTLTDHRAIRHSGVLEDRLEWMSWKKVTDVSVHRSLADRLAKTATVKVQSANEASGFKEMRGVEHPREFAQTIADLVNESHGPIILSPDSRRN